MAEPDSSRAQHDEAEGDENEEDQVEATAYKTIKDAVLFAIEVSPTMLAASAVSESKDGTPIAAALKCAYLMMQQRIISNPNDMMGILLFGTEKSKFQDGDEPGTLKIRYPYCYLMMDLDVPSAEDVKALKSVVEDEVAAHELLVPSKEPVSMANMLFCANQVFSSKAANFSSRRLFIVTDNDNPHAQDKALRSAATVRARDLYDLGVIIELFPISRLDHTFERNKFYDDIIYRLSPTDPDAPAPISTATVASAPGDGIGILNSLLSSVSSKAVARRALFSNLALEIGPGLKISVKGYIIFKRQVPTSSCYVWLNGEKAQVPKGISTQMTADTSRTVEKSEIKKAYKFGGEQIVFTPEEITSLRHFGDPVIRIIGFKPMDMLPIWAALKQSTYIYPSEEDYVGSTRVFSALHQKLLKDNKMGLSWFIARKNAAPVIAAVIPGAEVLAEQGQQVMPPGLWLVPLPYADDIRLNPETTLVPAPDTLVDMMRTVMQQLQLPKAQYNPERYPNPALQWHYRILQAMALDEDLPERPEDRTIPKYRQIDKRAGEYVIEWGQELEQQYRAWQKLNGSSLIGVKREGSAHDGGPPKKTKTATGAVPATSSEMLDDGEMRRHVERQTVSKLTVPILKGWLERKHVGGGGRKAELIDKVEQWFEQRK